MLRDLVQENLRLADDLNDAQLLLGLVEARAAELQRKLNTKTWQLTNVSESYELLHREYAELKKTVELYNLPADTKADALTYAGALAKKWKKGRKKSVTAKRKARR